MSEHDACEAQLSKAHDETRAAFENRALIYYYLFEEISKELGREKATEVMKRAIHRRGVEIGRKYQHAAASGDLEKVSAIFCEDSPCEGALFEPGVQEQAGGKVVLRMCACPLVDVWKRIGVAEEDVDLMCEIASAVDFGTFEGAGLELRFLERAGVPGHDRCLLELKLPKK